MRKNKILLGHLFFCLSLCVSGCGELPHSSAIPSIESQKTKAQHNDYANPIYPVYDGETIPTYTADPFVVRDLDGTYYLYCTQTDVYNGVGYIFRQGPVFASENLVRWEYCGDVFEDYAPEWGTTGAGVWAPTVIQVQDQWLYYYSLSVGSDTNPGIGVASSKTPYGPWRHYGKLFDSEEIGVTNAIDPYVFYDEGNLYMVFGSYGGLITLIELTDDGLGLKGGIEYQKEHKTALAGYEIFEVNNYEASFLFNRYGYYYLLLSTGTCLSGTNSTYHVVCGRSKSLFGPYLSSDGRDLFGPNRGETVIAPSLSGAMGVGHCAVIEDDAGALWMLYHGYNTQASGKEAEYRSLYLDQLLFDEETGYPEIENRIASNGETRHGPYIAALEQEV